MRAVLFFALSLCLGLLSVPVHSAEPDAPSHAHGVSHATFSSPLPSVSADSAAVTKTVLQWSRQLRTCDADADSDIETSGTTRVIYALGDRDPATDSSVTIHSTTGVKNVNLMSSPSTPQMPVDAQEVAFMTRPFPIDKDTSSLSSPGTYYHCQGFAHTFDSRMHIVKARPQVDYYHAALVHHMQLFRCATPLSESDLAWQGDCYAAGAPRNVTGCDQVEVITGWAVGGGEQHFPEDVGFPIGGDGTTYLMMQIHYHNPQGVTFNDSAGFVLTITPTLRKYNAAGIALHYDLETLAIPPKESAYDLALYTPSHCLTDLPATGVNVFASLLHTHVTGVSVRTQHFRQGVELPPLDSNEHYDFNFQQVVPLGTPGNYPKLMSGDNLKLTCTYNTMDRTSVTRGGIATTDEMCINYLWYYPAAYSKTNSLGIAIGTAKGAAPGNFSTLCAMVGGAYTYESNFAQPPVTQPLSPAPCSPAPKGARQWGTPAALNGSTGTAAISAEQWAVDKASYPQSVVLDDAGRVVLYWNVTMDASGANGIVRFAAEAETSGWVGVGLSASGAMVDSDSVIGWVKTVEEGAASVTVDLTDRYNREHRQPPIDASQDVFDVRGVQAQLPPTPAPINPIYYNTTVAPVPAVSSSTGAPSSSSTSSDASMGLIVGMALLLLGAVLLAVVGLLMWRRRMAKEGEGHSAAAAGKEPLGLDAKLLPSNNDSLL